MPTLALKDTMDNLHDTALQALKVMDLTRLIESDTPDNIIALCQDTHTAYGDTAAICIYPFFIPIAKRQLRLQNTPNIQIVTVVNFPAGDSDIEHVINEINHAIKHGADEIDVVFPYKALLAGDEQSGVDLISQCKEACGDKLLKVIIESGELKSKDLITKATCIAINAGANMIKTSTGKVPINSTLEAAEVILTTIKEMSVEKQVGFKASGGITTVVEAQKYFDLAKRINNTVPCNKRFFRLGASSLLTDITQTIKRAKH